MQVRRRASSAGSIRRSSVSARDIEAIQRAMQKQRVISNQLITVLLFVLPTFSMFYAQLIFMNSGQFYQTLISLFRPPFLLPPIIDIVAWKIVAVLLSIQLLFYWFLPQDTVMVLSTSIGDHRKAVNGFSSFLLMLLLFPLGAALKFYRPDLIFLHFHSIIGCLAILAIFTMIILYVSYRLGDQNTIDSLNEFFFGVEIYPTWADIDLKHFLRTRITLTLWALHSISALFHQRHLKGQIEISALCLCLLQLFYIFKSLWNEDLMLNALDSRRAKCGFYRIWGDLVFFPLLYCAPITTIVQLNIRISFPAYIALMLIGTILIFFSSFVERQKYDFRIKKGMVKISGNDPFFIQARYKTETGDGAYNLLLGSGYWGFCRHPNYGCEILIFFCFSMFQGAKAAHFYFPLIFLVFYLVARTLNDENRCLVKYGSSWCQYCQRVPYRFFPGVF
ncbi:unnamed protein product, partial [Mesorhabditis belari]|uniref:7-dehydrocholesterol reductase n=1 Tax=Mesorhabditis belari TaxID=2138241 RepID=A0AAF3JC71_9BILA